MPVAPPAHPDAAATLAAAEAVGGAMVQAGYSVETVQDVLSDIARVNNLPESEVLAFPNALLVSARGVGSTAPVRWQPPTGNCSSPRSTRCSRPWMPLAPVS